MVGYLPLFSGPLSLALLGSIMVDLLSYLNDLFDTIVLWSFIRGVFPGENLGNTFFILDPISSFGLRFALVYDCAILANKTPAVVQIFETVYQIKVRKKKKLTFSA